jgi:prepilin-type N-terminal cleavage/methylation domain-containing protein
MRSGLTLLETMVALVILALVVVAGLELLAGTTRLSAQAESWARAVVYAEEGLETTLTDPTRAASRADSLPGGYLRVIDTAPAAADPGLVRVDVLVTWGRDGRFTLSRLVEAP